MAITRQVTILGHMFPKQSCSAPLGTQHIKKHFIFCHSKANMNWPITLKVRKIVPTYCINFLEVLFTNLPIGYFHKTSTCGLVWLKAMSHPQYRHCGVGNPGGLGTPSLLQTRYCHLYKRGGYCLLFQERR